MSCYGQKSDQQKFYQHLVDYIRTENNLRQFLVVSSEAILKQFFGRFFRSKMLGNFMQLFG